MGTGSSAQVVNSALIVSRPGVPQAHGLYWIDNHTRQWKQLNEQAANNSSIGLVAS